MRGPHWLVGVSSWDVWVRAGEAAIDSTGAKLCLPGASAWGMVRTRWNTNIDGEEAAERSGSDVSPCASGGRIPMACHRIRRYALGLAGLLLVPPLLWIGVVLVAPTSWAKRHVVAALEAGTKRSVALSGLSVPLLGGVEFTGLSFGSPQSVDDPWLKAKKVRLGISICQLMTGKFEDCSIEIEGSELRVKRREDGSLELADFILPPPRETSARRHQEDESERISIAFHDASVVVIDEPVAQCVSSGESRR